MSATPAHLARRIILATTALVAASAHAAPPAADYELLFADEFDAPHVNERDWNFRLGPRTGTGIDGLNLARNVRVAGSHANHRDVVASGAYRAGVATRVTCVYDHAVALIYIDGALQKRVDGLMFSPTDTTAAGRLGANSGLYDAVGDVTLAADGPPPKAQCFQNYVGTLGDIRIHNRALTTIEVALLSAK